MTPGLRAARPSRSWRWLRLPVAAAVGYAAAAAFAAIAPLLYPGPRAPAVLAATLAAFGVGVVAATVIAAGLGWRSTGAALAAAALIAFGAGACMLGGTS